MRALFVVGLPVVAQDEGVFLCQATRATTQEFTMSLNPHPIVLTTAAERRRAELLALAEPGKRVQPGLSCSGSLPRWRVNLGTWVVSGILARLLAAVRLGEARCTQYA